MPAKISAAIRKRAARIKLFLCEMTHLIYTGNTARFFPCKHGYQTGFNLIR